MIEELVITFITKYGILAGAGVVLLVLALTQVPLMVKFSIEKRKAKLASDLSISKAKLASDLSISDKVANRYLNDEDKKTGHLDAYIENLNKRIKTLEEIELRHKTESKARDGEIQALKEWRIKDAAKIKEQTLLIQEQAMMIDTYKEAHDQLIERFDILEEWRERVEKVFGPWLEVVMDGFTPGDIEDLNGAMGGLVDEIRKANG